jgi:plastocyanin
MNIKRNARFLTIAISVVMLIAMPTSARTLDDVPVNVVTTAPGAQFHGYAAPVVVTQKRGTVTYVNLDIAPHNVVQDPRADGVAGPKKKPWCKAFRKRACPVFWTKQIAIGQQTNVLGLESVKPGKTYSFYCTLHPGMRGTLVVAP